VRHISLPVSIPHEGHSAQPSPFHRTGIQLNLTQSPQRLSI
jgi:hypothetical protein